MDSRKMRRRKKMTTSPAAAAAVDLISELSDDVLLHILSFLPAASDVVRTTVLSRRWRHLWSAAPCLRFAVEPAPPPSTSSRRADTGSRLVAAVDSVLARRAIDGADVETLKISFVFSSSPNDGGGGGRSAFDGDWHDHADDIESEHVAAWLRFAERHVTGDFRLDVPTLPRQRRQAELPSSARFKSMRLWLAYAELTVPTAAADRAFAALTDVRLSTVKVDDVNGRRLCDLFSSPACCPRLRRLTLEDIVGLSELRLRLDAARAATLETLKLLGLPDVKAVEVDAPGLRELAVTGVSLDEMAAPPMISAPRLRRLTFESDETCRGGGLMVLDGARMEIDILSHGFSGVADNRDLAWFLQHCAAADSLDVRLLVPLGEDLMNDIPEFPNITELRITAQVSIPTHTIGASIAKFVAKCSRIEYLSIDINKQGGDSHPGCKCEEPKDWKDMNLSLDHLRSIDIHHFRPSQDQMQLVSLLLANASSLQRMTIALHKRYVEAMEREDGKEVYLHIPCYGGHWTPCAWGSSSRQSKFRSATKYEWAPCNVNHEKGMKTTTPPPPPPPADDMISGLTEDLLLIILGFLPAARDVVRTSALSTRWRNLWTLAPALRFDIGQRNLRLTDDAEAAAAGRLVAAVDSVLARRDVDAGAPDVKDLEINFVFRSVVGDDQPTAAGRYYRSSSRFGLSRHRRRLPMDVAPASVAAWLRFAECRVAGAFSLELPALSSSRKVVADLPCSERLRTMRLTLGGATVGVPVAGAGADAYRSLADLLLSNVCLDDGDGVRLCNLLSSTSCPSLRRLELSVITGLTILRLDAAATLEELRLIGLRDMEQMEVDAPGLRDLTVKGITVHLMAAAAARIAAPRLQALAYEYRRSWDDCQLMVLDGERTAKLRVLSHGDPAGKHNNGAAAWKNSMRDVIKDIPKLTNITDLRITVAMSTDTMDTHAVAMSTDTMDTHAIGASTTKLIAKFSRIEYLSIDIDKKAGDCTNFDCKCEQYKGWNNKMIPLERLRIADIRNFLPFDDQIELVCVLIANAPLLEKMTVALHELYGETRQRRNDMDAYLCIPSCGGRWTPCSGNGSKFGSFTKYEWKPYKRKRTYKEKFSSLLCASCHAKHETAAPAAAAADVLRLIGLRHMEQMEVDAPGLRELVLKRIYAHLMAAASASSVRIAAPGLQALTYEYDYACWGGAFPMVLDGERTAKLQVLSHGVPDKDNNGAAAWFLQHCAAANRLDVVLKMEFDEEKMEEDIEDLIKDIPEVLNITDLRITVAISTGTVDTHAIGASVTKLIAKFRRIEYLSIDIDKKAGDCTNFDCKCEQHKGWSNEMIPLDHLRMVDIRDFLPFNDQIELVCALIASAPALEKMIVALHESYEETRERTNNMEAYLCIPSCGGRWTPCAWNGGKFGSATKYEWKPCKRKRSEEGVEEKMNGAMTSPAVAAVDLISGLSDDVLLHILGFLPAASDVARTSVLSTRWRHLWALSPALRFAVAPLYADVDAPGLRSLAVEETSLYFGPEPEATTRIAAPRLDALTYRCSDPGGETNLRFDGGRVEELRLASHAVHGGTNNAVAAWFLRQCAAVLIIDHEDIMKDIPELLNVTDLRINVEASMSPHRAGASLAKLIAKCCKAECLFINISDQGRNQCVNSMCICDQPEGWEKETISLECLRIVEISSFLPCKDQIRLMHLLLSNAPVLERMTVTIYKQYEDAKDLDLGILGFRGRWSYSGPEYHRSGFSVRYEWTPSKRRKVVEMNQEEGKL
uniref:F-box domain-containing protein n=1 Tax=Oryza barthii TaxID=65489 RepID=A0A0D3HV67_9ORYZ